MKTSWFFKKLLNFCLWLLHIQIVVQEGTMVRFNHPDYWVYSKKGCLPQYMSFMKGVSKYRIHRRKGERGHRRCCSNLFLMLSIPPKFLSPQNQQSWLRYRFFANNWLMHASFCKSIQRKTSAIWSPSLPKEEYRNKNTTLLRATNFN